MSHRKWYGSQFFFKEFTVYDKLRYDIDLLENTEFTLVKILMFVWKINRSFGESTTDYTIALARIPQADARLRRRGMQFLNQI